MQMKDLVSSCRGGGEGTPGPGTVTASHGKRHTSATAMALGGREGGRAVPGGRRTWAGGKAQAARGHERHERAQRGRPGRRGEVGAGSPPPGAPLGLSGELL